MKQAPTSEHELLARARALAGLTLAELAAQEGVALPADARREKGWTGQLIEHALGADAGNRAQPDFTALAVELKTLPLDRLGRPRESTYVCRAPSAPEGGMRWEQSLVWHKLRRVLWLPVEAAHETPLPTRRLGWAFLWSPSESEERLLGEDWEELHTLLCLGRRDEVSAHLGTLLQLRPKGADARETAPGYDGDGRASRLPPLGFYLRARFTRELLAQSNP